MTDYITGIKKTGYILEHEITQILKKNSWSIISNKFYEDDLAFTVREMDILAYKASSVDDISIYTALVISCKKNEDNAWALISRDINLGDPNSNWYPLHACTNDTATREVLNSENVNKEYYKFIFNESGVSIMQPPEVDVFAFQELNKSTGKPQNDKNIFSSLTTLMKAQSYEIDAIEDRKRNNKCIYQFNLISVIDSDLIRLHLIDDNIIETQLETEQLVARYIIKKKQQFFRIRFIKADSFSKYVESYNELHASNIVFFQNQRNLFYTDLIKDLSKVNLFLKEFTNGIVYNLIRASGYKLNRESIERNILVIWEEHKHYLRIFVTPDEIINQALNQDEEVLLKTKEYLFKIYRFTGDFKYEVDNCPF